MNSLIYKIRHGKATSGNICCHIKHKENPDHLADAAVNDTLPLEVCQEASGPYLLTQA